MADSESRSKTLARLSPEDRADLVAYLDGELPPEKEKAIDHVLANNEVARREVARLSEAYELLDYLPPPEAHEDLTQSTMATIRRQAGDKAALVPRRLDWSAPLKAAALAFAVTLGSAAGVRLFIPSESDQVLDYLPVLTRLEELRVVRDRDFAEWLAVDGTRRMIEETTR